MLVAAPLSMALEPLNKRYLLVDLTHPAWPALLTTLTGRHQEIRPGSQISVSENNDGTQAVVKILGATTPWLAANGLPNHPAVIRFEEDNLFAKDLYRTDPAWSNKVTLP
jgi:hypothetical protein